ncbi:hypothetical protein LZS85_15665 [Aliivibrio fischeri]|uniref:hypothetical protein n=1 Tax=Aliivibrio fischeri TaxID=668 RepID=UPI001F3E5345|nr:hypothetical protein [Aliivibrio fischeri]MCE7567561.1 hypothetical protein [Aliivibrio fischeri]
MCEHKERVIELESQNAELYKALTESIKFEAEAKDFSSKTFWRPVKIVFIPILISFMAGVGTITAALMALK